MVSLTPTVVLDGAAADAAAQQSKRNKTSALAFTRSGWTANHSSDPWPHCPVLRIVVSGEQEGRMADIPKPNLLSCFVHSSVPSVIDYK